MMWLSGERVLERIRGALDGQVPVKLADPAISAKELAQAALGINSGPWAWLAVALLWMVPGGPGLVGARAG